MQLPRLKKGGGNRHTSALAKATQPVYRRMLPGLAFVLALVGAARFLSHAIALVAFPYEVANGEGLVLLDAVRIAAGEPMYRALDHFPLLVSAYPPLFPAVAVPLVKLLGPSLAATRLVSLLASVAASVVIAVLVRRGGAAWLPSVTCGLTYLSAVFVYEWGGWGRVDMLAVVLSLGAIAAAGQQGRWGAPLAAALSLLALFTKQTALAAPLAIALWLSLQDVRRAGVFVGLVVVPGLAILAALAWATHGQAMVHLVGYQVLPYFPRHLLAQWRALAATHPFLLAATAGAVVAARGQWRRPSLSLVYLAVATALTVSSGRTGSSTNFFLEPLAAAVVLAGAWWASPSPLGRAVVPALLALQVLWSVSFRATPAAPLYPSTWEFTFEPRSAEFAACTRLDAWITSTSGPLLVEDVGWAVRHQREFPADPLYLTELSRLGTLPLRSNLLLAVDAGAFPLAILHYQAFDPEILERIQARYEVVDHARCVADYTVLVPR